MRNAALWLLMILFLRAAAQGVDAGQLYKMGREAEKAGKLDRAYVFYSEAAALEPNNRTYWLRSQSVRARAALQALPLPNSIPAEVPEPSATELENATTKEVVAARKPQPPAELKASPETKDFDLLGDSRALFEQVAQAFGLDCVFDGDYQAGRPVRFRITSANYQVALNALELATGSFIVPVTDKVFLVAKDTPQKRNELEPSVTTTLEIPEATTPQELTQIATAVQQVMALEKIGFDSQNNTVVLRGSISKVVPARAIFEQLIHHRPQIAVELDFLEVNRNDMLTYGLSLPNLFSIKPVNIAGTALTTLENLSHWGPAGTLFAVGVGSAQLLAQFSNSKATSLMHVDLRAVDAQAATFHVGQRYPVLTSGFFGSPNANTTTTIPTNGSTPVTSSNNLQTPTTFGNVANPSATVIGDFNRDGIPDFAAAVSGANEVAVYLGKGNGTFGDPTTYATGKNPSAILAVDLNADGYLDLVVADADSNDISVLAGNGDGTFKDAVAFSVGTKPAAVVTADFNQDGYPDLAVANSGSNTISILFGKGDGTFQERQTLQAGTSPRSLVAADFDRDGKEDLAVANYSSNDLWIFLNNGDGTFRNSATYSTGNAPRAVTADNLNQDSNIDLLVANSSSNTISVFLGDGTGAFTSGKQFNTGSGPVSIVTADFNSDAIKDVAVANSGDGTVSLLLGLGDGTFQTAINVTIGTGTQPVFLSLGDLNRDGYQDLLVTNFATDNFSVLLGSGNGGFHDSNGNNYSYTGGQTYAPPPAFTFEDLGLVVKVTPHVHGMDEVALDLEGEIKLLTGKSINGVPEIAHRAVKTWVQLKNGDSAVVAGLISTTEARSILGTAGLSTLPAIGPLMRSNTKNTDSTELLIVVRPVLISLPPDQFVSRPVFIGSETHPLTPM